MSNHTGGYLLNYALHRFVEKGLVERLGKRKVQAIVLDVIKFATRQYDCNEDEILDELGEKLGLCYYCLQPVTELKDNVCLRCRKEGGWDDDEEEEEAQAEVAEVSSPLRPGAAYQSAPESPAKQRKTQRKK